MSKKIVKLKKNELLFNEGDTPDAMYIIQKGRLGITKKKGKSEIILAELKQGDLLGEMAFFDKSPRSASAKAVSAETEVIELPFAALEQQFQNLPVWVKSIMKAVNGHLRRANMKIRQLEKTKEEEREVFSDHAITSLMSILGFVAYRYGQESEHGLQIPGGMLRTYTIQVFHQATHKMQTLTEVLADLGYMEVENLGEGKIRMIVHDLDFIFRFVEFYNKQQFDENAKKFHVAEHQLKSLKVIKFYGEKAAPDTRGFVNLNLTTIAGISMKEMGMRLNIEDVRILSETGMLGDYSADDGSDFLDLDIEYISAIVPFWDLVYTLKAFQSD